MDPDELELQMKARARMRMTQAAPPTQSPGFLEETGNVLGGAAVDAGMALATIPGGVDELARHIARWIEEKRTGQPQPVPPTMFHYPKSVLGGEAIFPTPSELKSRLETDTGLKAPEAKTPIGKAIQGPASLAMQSLIMPGNALANVGKYAVAPTIAATAAEKLTGKLGGSEADREIAAAAAGIGVGGAFARSSPKPIPMAPTTEELASASRAEYGAAKAMDMAITPEASQRLTKGLKDLHDERVADPDIETKSIRQLGRIEEKVAEGPMTINELERRRQVLGKIEREGMTPDGNPTADANLAGDMIDHIDDHMASLGERDLLGTGNPQDMVARLQEARRLFRLRRNGEKIQLAFHRAENSAAANRGNMDDAIRVQFRKIADNPRQLKSFDPETQKAILEVVRADKPERAMRFLARFSPEQRPWSTAFGAAISGHLLGPAAAMAVPLAGAAGNAMAGARTLRQAQRASALSRGGIQEPNNAILRFPALIPGLGNMATQGPR